MANRSYDTILGEVAQNVRLRLNLQYPLLQDGVKE